MTQLRLHETFVGAVLYNIDFAVFGCVITITLHTMEQGFESISFWHSLHFNIFRKRHLIIAQ